MSMQSHLNIQYTCPQCGGPVVMDETDRLVQCGYCRIRSYFLVKDYFRYVVPAHRDYYQSNLVYFPYWHTRGMQFYYSGGQICHRFFDASIQAIEDPSFPVSAGLRTQGLRLHHLNPSFNGRFLRPRRTPNEAVRQFETILSAKLPHIGKIPLQAYIGEVLNLIYMPFYIRGEIQDAVTQKKISTKTPDIQNDSLFPVDKPKKHYRIIATLCPNCAWELSGERNSLALTCENCGRVWEPDGYRLKKMTYGCIPRETDQKKSDILFLPFWRIKADVSGVSLKTYADLVRLANLPKVVQPGWDRLGFRFWVPAFKALPRAFIRIATMMTYAQPAEKVTMDPPDARLYPVSLPLSEAIECTMVVLSGIFKPVHRYLEILDDLKIVPRKYLLVYVPFVEDARSYHNQKYQLTLEKNMLEKSLHM